MSSDATDEESASIKETLDKKKATLPWEKIFLAFRVAVIAACAGVVMWQMTVMSACLRRALGWHLGDRVLSGGDGQVPLETDQDRVGGEADGRGHVRVLLGVPALLACVQGRPLKVWTGDCERFGESN